MLTSRLRELSGPAAVQWVKVHVDVLIPLKRLDYAKMRLREHLSSEMAVRVMKALVENAVLEAQRAPSVSRVFLVSSDSRSREMATRWGVDQFDDRGLSWNDGLRAAMTEVVGTESVLILSADVPLVTSDAIEAFIAATPLPGMGIARARDAGTNAIVMSPPAAAETCFGVPGSAARHAELAVDAGLHAVIVDEPALAFDLDSFEDLREVLEHDLPVELGSILEEAATSMRH